MGMGYKGSTYKTSMQFIPDWYHAWTVMEAEMQLKGFKFAGPGWYMTKAGGCMLVIPDGQHEVKDVWKQRWPIHTKFCFYVWTRFNPAHVFDQIVQAPTRKDTSEG